LALFLPLNSPFENNILIFSRLKPLAMITRFFSWIKRRFTKDNKKAIDGFNDNPFLIL